MNDYAGSDEQIDDLQLKGLRIIQKRNSFRFGTDAVLLSYFANIKEMDKVLDIGTGTGIIPLLLYAKKNPCSITGLEILENMSDMAQRSVKMNNLTDRINIVCGDIKNSVLHFGKATFDAIVTNPPYKKSGSGIKNVEDELSTARHETKCTLEDIIKAASLLLKTNGRFSMVHRPERLADIMQLMRQYKLEPKELRFVYPGIHKKPVLLLVNAVKGGGSFLKVLEPLVIYKENGKYTDEMLKIYNLDA